MVSPIFVSAGLLPLVNLFVTVKCDCCAGEAGTSTFDINCYDGTKGTPCCGYGQCNIFCCNCDGGCRLPPSNSSPGLGSVPEKDAFLKMDRNSDGFVDKEEARDYLHVSVHVYGTHTEKLAGFDDGFNKLDKLGNAKLSLADIDGGKKVINNNNNNKNDNICLFCQEYKNKN